LSGGEGPDPHCRRARRFAKSGDSRIQRTSVNPNDSSILEMDRLLKVFASSGLARKLLPQTQHPSEGLPSRVTTQDLLGLFPQVGFRH